MSGAWVPPTLAEIQPGALRRSIVLEASESLIPISKVVRARGGVVSVNGEPDRAVRDKSGCVVRFIDESEVYDRRPIERHRAERCGQTEPFLGRTPAEAAENLRIKLGRCPHGLAEEVRLCTGEIVAAVCPTCLDVLPAAFVGSDWRP